MNMETRSVSKGLVQNPSFSKSHSLQKRSFFRAAKAVLDSAAKGALLASFLLIPMGCSKPERVSVQDMKEMGTIKREIYYSPGESVHEHWCKKISENAKKGKHISFKIEDINTYGDTAYVTGYSYSKDNFGVRDPANEDLVYPFKEKYHFDTNTQKWEFVAPKK